MTTGMDENFELFQEWQKEWMSILSSLRNGKKNGWIPHLQLNNQNGLGHVSSVGEEGTMAGVQTSSTKSRSLDVLKNVQAPYCRIYFQIKVSRLRFNSVNCYLRLYQFVFGHYPIRTSSGFAQFGYQMNYFSKLERTHQQTSQQ